MVNLDQGSYISMEPRIELINEDQDGSLENEGACIHHKSLLSRRERRRIETRDRLFEAAMQLFSENDFDSVTIEMITELADVGKGTFFNYFANKEAVLGYRFETTLAFLESFFSSATDTPNEILEIEETTVGGPVWRQLEAVRRVACQTEGQSRRLKRNLLALSLTNDQVREASQSVGNKISSLICEQIEKGQLTGEFRIDFSAQSLSKLICEAYFGAMYQWAVSDGLETFVETLDKTFALVWESVRNPIQIEG